MSTKTQKPASSADDLMLEEMAKDETTKAKFKSVPTVGCGTMQNPRKIIFVQFIGEPKVSDDGTPVKNKDDENKQFAWTAAKLLKPTQGWDKETKADVQVEAGAEVNINLARHKGLWAAMAQYLGDYLEGDEKVPSGFELKLAGRKFAIATVGRTKVGKGMAFDYRVKENPEGV